MNGMYGSGESWELLKEWNWVGQAGEESQGAATIEGFLVGLEMEPLYRERVRVSVEGALRRAVLRNLDHARAAPCCVRLLTHAREAKNSRPAKAHEDRNGWGFFLVERIAGEVSPAQVVEVYLYRETDQPG